MSVTSGLSATIYRNRNDKIIATLVGPGDITDFKIWFTAKVNKNDIDSAAVITKKSANNGGSDSQAKVTDGPNGVLEIYFIPTDTVNLSASEYWFDIVIENTVGEKKQALGASTLIIKQPVTLT
jgi:hypothetical protein